MPSLTTLPHYLLISLLLYGSLSRFTHGVYTPTFYEYQTARSPDDGSLLAIALPIFDALLALGLIFGSRRVKLGITMFVALTMTGALVGFVVQGKGAWGEQGKGGEVNLWADAAGVGVAVSAVLVLVFVGGGR